MTKLAIAAVQAAPKLFDPPETEARFSDWLDRAAARIFSGLTSIPRRV